MYLLEYNAVLTHPWMVLIRRLWASSRAPRRGMSSGRDDGLRL